ncbi:Porphobilinogen deaminase, putative [Pediculus humanus corporis]|uniref:hydroxymethylbilane synthase n=1 Tax=Pediculus humanus subsp. corporis TaxID=121224 RepID=E0VQB4_PEDHC|nr:Porphobilinogen deaminase, putative [Pediculus humanus corporis]EEB15570.1 Porphobilinogen deaminase, putative [Pediculus humanus corporis]
MTDSNLLKVGSRKSQLALSQTQIIVNQLKENFPDLKFDIVTMLTTGDKILDKPLPKIGEKSLFTKELEAALEKNEVDFVVHSLKDLPTSLPPNLTIGAILKREDPRDALVVNKNLNFKNVSSLPESSVIGTSSLRRCAQLCRNYPNLKVENIRGNLNTRLKKLDEGDKYTGIVLAAAGLKRLKYDDRITQILEPNEMLYAVGQGALAVECNKNNEKVLDILEVLNDHSTILRVIAERSFLKTLGGGCSAPVAVSTKLEEKELYLTGAVWSLNGEKHIQKTKSVTISSDEPLRKKSRVMGESHAEITARNISNNDLNLSENLGILLAQDLIKLGALNIISEAKSINEIPNESPKEKK